MIASKRQNTLNVFDKMFEVGMCVHKNFERSVRTDGQLSLTKVYKIRSVICLALIGDYLIFYLSPHSVYFCHRLTAKGGLISETFSLWLKSPKKSCPITDLSIFSLGG